MTAALRFDPIRLPAECEKLRKEVRAFLAEEIAAGTFDPHSPQGGDTDVPGFSKRVGERGRMSILICSGAYFNKTGPLWRSATKNRRVGALATRISSVTT